MFNSPMNQAIANKIKKINQRYVSHLQKIEGGNIFDDIYDAMQNATHQIRDGVSNVAHSIGLGKPMKKYVKGSYKGGRVLSTALVPIVEEPKVERSPMKDNFFLSEPIVEPIRERRTLADDRFRLPKEMSYKVEPEFKEQKEERPKSEEQYTTNEMYGSITDKPMAWFNKAKDAISNFFGYGKKKPTKKQMKEIEQLFRKEDIIFKAVHFGMMFHYGAKSN